MKSEEFITAAIEAGSRNGIDSLDPIQRMVFLISEAEVDCDMNGIETFLDKYGTKWLWETAAAFEAVGAVDIAAALRAIKLNTADEDLCLDKLNDLVTSRAGYDYDAIHRVVENRLVERGG